MLTPDDRAIVLAHRPLARRIAWEISTPAMDLQERIASAEYALCLSALIRPRPDPFWQYATIACRRQILRDASQWRKARIGPHPIIALSSYDVAKEDAGPIDLAIERDELERLAEVIGRLPEPRRQIVRLTLAGLDCVEIAEVMGRETRATQIALKTGIVVLKNTLENSGETS